MLVGVREGEGGDLRLWRRWRGSLTRRVLSRRSAASRHEVADSTVAALGERLRGRRCGEGPLADVVVASLLHYGAVDIDERHLIVWVLLAGAEADLLPERWPPESVIPTTFDAALVPWLRSIAEEVRQAFADAGWPDHRRVFVLFDAAERVERVGWHYFK